MTSTINDATFELSLRSRSDHANCLKIHRNKNFPIKSRAHWWTIALASIHLIPLAPASIHLIPLAHSHLFFHLASSYPLCSSEIIEKQLPSGRAWVCSCFQRKLFINSENMVFTFVLSRILACSSLVWDLSLADCRWSCIIIHLKTSLSTKPICQSSQEDETDTLMLLQPPASLKPHRAAEGCAECSGYPAWPASTFFTLFLCLSQWIQQRCIHRLSGLLT